jgi:hypothetical protein
LAWYQNISKALLKAEELQKRLYPPAWMVRPGCLPGETERYPYQRETERPAGKASRQREAGLRTDR